MTGVQGMMEAEPEAGHTCASDSLLCVGTFPVLLPVAASNRTDPTGSGGSVGSVLVKQQNSDLL